MDKQDRDNLKAMATQTLAGFEIRYANNFLMEKGDDEFRGGTIGGHVISSIGHHQGDEEWVALSAKGEPLGYCMLLPAGKNREIIGMLIVTDFDSARNPDGTACYEVPPSARLCTEPIHPTGLPTIMDFGFG
jgi:hypothetical protein